MEGRGRENAGLFPVLEPPPGGLARLRSRIRKERRRRARVWAAELAAAGVAASALAVALLIAPRPDIRALRGFESDLLAVQLGIVAPPAEPVSIRPDLRAELAVRRIPTADDRVILYLVGSRSENGGDLTPEDRQ